MKPRPGQKTWDDLVAWGVRQGVDPETPVSVKVVGDDLAAPVYTAVVENGQIVLMAQR